MQKKNHIILQDLEVYKLACELARIGWKIYEGLDWQDKKIMGDQFITATDSVGANIVEGYRRFHYLDKIKFLYTSRASFAEARDYWLERMYERNKVSKNLYDEYSKVGKQISIKLQNFITAIYKAKNAQ